MKTGLLIKRLSLTLFLKSNDQSTQPPLHGFYSGLDAIAEDQVRHSSLVVG